MTKYQELKNLIRLHQQALTLISQNGGFGNREREVQDKILIIARLKKQLRDMPLSEREQEINLYRV